MTEKLRGILIDPYTKSITEVFTGEYPAWKNLIEVDMIEAVTIAMYDDGSRETVWIDEEGLLNEKKDGPYFSITTYHQPLAGKGIVLLSDEAGETRSTRLSVEQVEHFTVWRSNVKFVGMKNIEPHDEDHPIFGKVAVVGHTAQFAPKDEEDKDA